MDLSFGSQYRPNPAFISPILNKKGLNFHAMTAFRLSFTILY